MAHISIPEIPLAERKTFSLGEAAGLTGLCVSTLYNLMGNGRLQTIKVGGRRLVTREALDALLGVSGADVDTQAPFCSPLFWKCSTASSTWTQ
jgi:excisionase family DNA binding protein